MTKPLVVELQSLVDTHEEPFLVIDRFYTIVAVNDAFTQSYNIKASDIVGKYCYQSSHSKSKPCDEFGDECPYEQVFESQSVHSCLHVHHDNVNNNHRVRVTAYPIKALNGELYLGESILELHTEQENLEDGVSMVGISPVFLQMIEQLLNAAKGDAPILLHGDTGTGKELAASFLHQQSSRKNAPFLTLDCTVLTENLFESEVFGYEKGAFTGSHGKKIGLFELADGGTLFLDELGELSAMMQAKLLRVLESGEFRRVGGTKTHFANVRIVCATNRDLQEEINTGNFREDLYYRIAGISVRIPSLRERLEDIPLLVHLLLDRINKARKTNVCLTDDALNWLENHHFPGNIRELRNILSAAVAACKNKYIHKEQLQQIVLPNNVSKESQASQTSAIHMLPNELNVNKIPKSLTDIEKEQISLLLNQFSGNRKQIASHLGISVRTLYRKLNKYAIK